MFLQSQTAAANSSNPSAAILIEGLSVWAGMSAWDKRLDH